MVKLTKRKQSLLQYLGKDYIAKNIDCEPCIYRDFGEYDIEISGGHKNSECVTIYLWEKKERVKVVENVTVENNNEKVAKVLKQLFMKYQLQ